MPWPRRKKDDEDIAGLEALGRAVRELREKGGWNQIQVAARADLSASTIYGVERAAMELTWSNLRRLAKGPEVDLATLLELAESHEEGGER